MTEQPEPYTLPVHEAQVRAYAAGSGDVVLRRHLTAVLAEHDRRGELLAIRDEQVEENNAIIEAAYRVAASWSPHSVEEFDGDLVAALVREVQR